MGWCREGGFDSDNLAGSAGLCLARHYNVEAVTFERDVLNRRCSKWGRGRFAHRLSISAASPGVQKRMLKTRSKVSQTRWVNEPAWSQCLKAMTRRSDVAQRMCESQRVVGVGWGSGGFGASDDDKEKAVEEEQKAV